jgi:hypothetical protein
LHQVIKVLRSKKTSKSMDDEEDVLDNPHDQPEDDESLLEYAALTCGILLASFAIALCIQSLEMVLGFVGSTGSTTISFILPSIFYLKLFSKETGRRARILRVLAWGLLIYGFTIMVRALITGRRNSICAKVVCLSLNTYEAIKSTHRVTRGKHHSDGGH